eukprot:TRINITY_DN4347_c0_g1_i2.p1 TRINITY_DN4347_c0_g1~~TRINITY_DN4347_c0_g1_i2.p1  ORF type:complete len:286 (+),score=-0.11 TRINITY_DN4347_c0_g1_i2:91-858(+)
MPQVLAQVRQRCFQCKEEVKFENWVDLLWAHCYVGEVNRALLQQVLDANSKKGFDIKGDQFCRLIWCYALCDMNDSQFFQIANQHLTNASRLSRFRLENLFLLWQACLLMRKSQQGELQISRQLHSGFRRLKTLVTNEGCDAFQSTVTEVGNIIRSLNDGKVHIKNDQILPGGIRAQFLLQGQEQRSFEKGKVFFVDSDLNFSVGEERVTIGEALARNRVMQLFGYKVCVVDEKQWLNLETAQQKEAYVRNLIEN